MKLEINGPPIKGENAIITKKYGLLISIAHGPMDEFVPAETLKPSPEADVCVLIGDTELTFDYEDFVKRLTSPNES